MTKKNEDIFIVYASIIREKKKILSEYTECSGNFSQIILQIMDEVVLTFENPPEIYRTYFCYGKYTLFLIKYKKLYISIMFPSVKINNSEIIFSLLYCFFDKLKSFKDLNLEAISKMRQYTLNFTNIFKEQINKFYKDSSSFISYLSQSNEFVLYEPFEKRIFESQIQLPILSNQQVHEEKKDKEGGEEISFRKSYNSIMTQDSYRDDILDQDKNEKLVEGGEDNSDIVITSSSGDDILKLKQKNSREDENNNNNCVVLKWVIIIIFILLVLSGIVYGIISNI